MISQPFRRAAFVLTISALALPMNAQFVEIGGLIPPTCGGPESSFVPAVDVDGHVAVVAGESCATPGADCDGTLDFLDRFPSGEWVRTQTACTDSALELHTRGVAIGGEWVLTGGPAGTTEVFRRDAAGLWIHDQTVASDQVSDDSYLGTGDFLSISGSRALRGSAQNGAAGVVYVLEEQGGVWSQVAELTPSDGHAVDWFGCATALSGDIALIGAKRMGAAPGDPLEVSAAGAAYVFERQPDGTWLEVAKLEVDAPWIQFGRAVAIDGTRAAVSATTPLPPGVGAAFVFERTPSGTWEQTQRIQSLPSNNDFASAVSLSGDLLAVGASDDSQGGPGIGAVYVYVRDELAAWSKVKTLFSAQTLPGAGLGSAVSIDGGVIFAVERSQENAVFFETPVLPYGCGSNPSGSLTLLAGSTQLGSTLTVGIDNPLGTQAAGSLPVLFASVAPLPTYPCGIALPGLGMGGAAAAGELLVSFGPADLAAIVAGPNWAGPGSPAPIAIGIPDAPALIGVQVFLQGALADPSLLGGVGNALTSALEIRFE